MATNSGFRVKCVGCGEPVEIAADQLESELFCGDCNAQIVVEAYPALLAARDGQRADRKAKADADAQQRANEAERRRRDREDRERVAQEESRRQRVELAAAALQQAAAERAARDEEVASARRKTAEYSAGVIAAYDTRARSRFRATAIHIVGGLYLLSAVCFILVGAKTLITLAGLPDSSPRVEIARYQILAGLGFSLIGAIVISIGSWMECVTDKLDAIVATGSHSAGQEPPAQ